MNWLYTDPRGEIGSMIPTARSRPTSHPAPVGDIYRRARNQHDEGAFEQMPDQNNLEVHSQQRGPYSVLELSGPLEESTVAEFLRQVGLGLRQFASTAVVDMTGVVSVDTDGFGALIHLQKQLSDSGRRLVLLGCRESVRMALSITRLEVLLPTFVSLDQISRARI